MKKWIQLPLTGIISGIIFIVLDAGFFYNYVAFFFGNAIVALLFPLHPAMKKKSFDESIIPIILTAWITVTAIVFLSMVIYASFLPMICDYPNRHVLDMCSYHNNFREILRVFVLSAEYGMAASILVLIRAKAEEKQDRKLWKVLIFATLAGIIYGILSIYLSTTLFGPDGVLHKMAGFFGTQMLGNWLLSSSIGLLLGKKQNPFLVVSIFSSTNISVFWLQAEGLDHFDELIILLFFIAIGCALTASITSRIPELVGKREAEPSPKVIVEEDKFKERRKEKLRKEDRKEKYILKIARDANYHVERISLWLERKPVIKLIVIFASLITVLTFLYNVVTFFFRI